jgi:hypothetical protein
VDRPAELVGEDQVAIVVGVASRFSLDELPLSVRLERGGRVRV